MDNDIINEQIAYYCARAQEYDESVLRIGRYASSIQTILPPLERVSWVGQVLQELKQCNHILELACGTGLWTRELVSIGKTITAVDASPEMLAINQYKISDKRIHYLQADIFQWQPDQQYDLVFFANWLSHVPPERLNTFLTQVVQAVKPGGQLCIVDQYAPTIEDMMLTKDDTHQMRTLYDGRTYTIVKVFYNPYTLEYKLAKRGLIASTKKVDGTFFYLIGERSYE